MASQKLFIDIVARDKATKALTGLRGGLARVRGAVFNLKTAFLGLGAGLVIRNLVNTGKNLENLQVRLKFLLKDTNEGAKAFQNMTKFASRVPFSLEEIQSGSGILATVTDNADDLQNMLEITGNVAATTGLDFRTAAEQIQRSFSAGIGAADLFREKGVRNMLGFKAGATVSIEETREAFARVFGQGGQFGKATDELAKTFEGTISMIGDKIFNFKRVLLEAGLFEELKSQFGDLDNFLQNNAKELDRIATAVGKNLANALVRAVEIGRDLIPMLRSIGNLLKSMIDGFMALPPILQQSGIVGATLFGKKGFGALIVASLFVDKLMDFTRSIKGSLGLIDETNLKDVQFRIDQIKNQIEQLKKTSDFLNVEGGFVNDESLQNLEKELARLEELEERLRMLAMLEKQGFSIARERQIMENANFNKQNESSKNLLKTFKNLNEKSLKDLKEKLENINTIIADGIDKNVTKVSNSIARSIVLGEKLSDTFKNIAQDAVIRILSGLVEMGIRILGNIAIIKIEEMFGRKKTKNQDDLNNGLRTEIALRTIIAAFGGGGGGGGIPFFNKGGSVRKNQPVIVGDSASGRGGELFVPNSSGQIIPNSRLGSMGGGVNVNFNINTVDATGFEELLVNSRGTISQLINQALNEKGQGNLI